MAPKEQHLATETVADVKEVLKRLREQLAARAEKEFASSVTAQPPVPALPPEQLPSLRQLLAVTDSAMREIGELNPRGPGLLNSLVQKGKRLLQRMLSWYTRPITQAQALNVQFLTEATALLEWHDAQIRALEERTRLQRAEFVQLSGQIQSKLDWIIFQLEQQEAKKP